MLGTEPFKRRQDQFMLKGEDQPENIDGRRELKRRDGGDKYGTIFLYYIQSAKPLRKRL